MTFINDACAPPPAARWMAAHPVLGVLPPGALEALAQAATRREHADGDTLFFEGDEARHCLFVERGAVEVLRYDAAGEERMLHRFEAGRLLAEAAMFMPHGLYPMTARASGPAAVWRIPRAALRTACERHPPLALRLLESLSLRLYQRVNEVDWLTRSNAQQRLAAYLVAQSGRQGAQLELPTSQRHLAAHLGIRAETLNRILSDWQAQGWVRGGRRRWHLLDVERLRGLAAPGDRAF
jgi:CRP-like cAMP-binding protein